MQTIIPLHSLSPLPLVPGPRPPLPPSASESAISAVQTVMSPPPFTCFLIPLHGSAFSPPRFLPCLFILSHGAAECHLARLARLVEYVSPNGMAEMGNRTRNRGDGIDRE